MTMLTAKEIFEEHPKGWRDALANGIDPPPGIFIYGKETKGGLWPVVPIIDLPELNEPDPKKAEEQMNTILSLISASVNSYAVAVVMPMWGVLRAADDPRPAPVEPFDEHPERTPMFVMTVGYQSEKGVIKYARALPIEEKEVNGVTQQRLLENDDRIFYTSMPGCPVEKIVAPGDITSEQQQMARKRLREHGIFLSDDMMSMSSSSPSTRIH